MEFTRKALHVVSSGLMIAAFVGAGALSGCASAPGSAANSPPAGPKGVYFVAPQDGATVSSPFKVQFGVKGMTIKEAGDQIAGTGHHHLLINLDSKPTGEIIPFDEKHIHFGKGQTEAEVKLAPGTYKLTMQFADGFHLSYGKEMSASMTVTVK